MSTPFTATGGADDAPESIRRYAARALAVEILLVEPGSLEDDELEERLRSLKEKLLARTVPLPKSNDYSEAAFETLLEWVTIELDRMTETLHRVTAAIFPS